MRTKRMLALAGLLASCLGLPSCGGKSAPSSLDQLSNLLMVEQCRTQPTDECFIAALADLVLSTKFVWYEDEAVQSYVEGVGARLAGQMEADTSADHKTWRFRLIDSDEVQAYAHPGGYIYVDRGVLLRLGSEAELAALLAHEMGHVLAGHSRQHWQGISRDPLTAAEEYEARAYDRHEEKQADELAVRYLVKAGYDPRAVLTMLRTIDQIEKNETIDEAESPAREGSDRHTHPATTTRLARVARLIGRDGSGEWGRQRYSRHLDGMVVGADPRRGYLEGRTYVCADINLALTFGRGWKIAAVRGKLDAFNHERGVESGLARLSELQVAALSERLASGRRQKVAGYAARVGWITDLDSEAGKIGLVALLETPGRTFALVVAGSGRSTIRAAFDELVARLRSATQSEVDKATPNRISLVEVDRAGTVGELARRLCKEPELTIELEGDPTATRPRGDLLRCTTGSIPNAP